jgi:hypothetical protein
MKHIKLFENFEIAEPIGFGEPLNSKEIKLLEGYKLTTRKYSRKTTIGGKLITR